MIKNQDPREMLFLKKALEAKKSSYGSIIQPIGKIPLIAIVMIFFLLFSLGLISYLYKMEKTIGVKGTTLLANKPTKLIGSSSGIVSKVYFSNGNLVKSNQILVELHQNKEDCLESIPPCEKPVGLIANVDGYIEQFYLTEGDRIREGAVYGIIVPQTKDNLFEFSIPVELIRNISISQEVEIFLSSLKNKDPIIGKIIFISIIPINKDSKNYLTVLVKPPLNTRYIPVGTNVEFKIIESNKTIFEMLKRS